MKKLLLATTFIVSSLFAGGDRFHDFAKVRYSEPIYEYVYEQEPQRQCDKVRKRVRDYNSSSVRSDSLGIDTLVGVAAGAVLGSQVGKGNGRVAAQIVGGLLGGKVAHEIRNNYHSDNSNYSYVTTTECYDTYKNVERKVITGYKNYFVYKGVEHYKVTKRPKKRVKITHSISF
ncbi:MAG: glycine zipper 2TM domain-containing protein [Campylobacteraceae bacterium]|nr:glycine zipper 2TM domain-containing protein [Campylobacteraceae bacterium]